MKENKSKYEGMNLYELVIARLALEKPLTDEEIEKKRREIFLDEVTNKFKKQIEDIISEAFTSAKA